MLVSLYIYIYVISHSLTELHLLSFLRIMPRWNLYWRKVLWISGPQPFWHQGLVTWKTSFPWTGGCGGMVQAVMWAKGSDGERQMKLRLLATRLLLCCPVPQASDHYQGLGTPAVDYSHGSSLSVNPPLHPRRKWNCPCTVCSVQSSLLLYFSLLLSTCFGWCSSFYLEMDFIS